MTSESPLRAEHFRRVDESPDRDFYREPRLVTHIDDAAIAAVTAFYRELLPANGRILDLMSSWVSHLPADLDYSRVTGLGMNAAELDANGRLTERVVQDLNADPVLPWAEGSFDAAIVTVSVQYLTRPAEVFAEVGRVLAPGGPFAILYSNRCFPTKAVAVWQMLGSKEHADLIGLYFREAGIFSPPQAFDLSPNPGSTDPLFAVVARKVGGPGGDGPPAGSH